MKKITAFIISISMVLAAVPVSAATQQISGAESYGKLDKKTGEYEYYDSGNTVPENIGEAKLPEKYDLRDHGRSTSVKDQLPHEFCWAFATLASMESNLITKGLADKTIDLSEAHLGYYFKNGSRDDNYSKYCGRDSGSDSETANYYNSAATLARGYGAVEEKDFPYSAYQGSEPDSKYVSDKLMAKSTYELTDAIVVHGNPTEKDYDKPAVDTVKRLIMENGAVASRMDFPFGNEWLLKEFGAINIKDLKAFYEKEEDVEQGSGHAITIIGWDDTYNDFPSADVKVEITDKKTDEKKIVDGNKPAGPGAWIVKDSYGEVIHGGGYFYMSYYSANLFQYASFVARKSTNKQTYQYDGIGLGENMLKFKNKVSGANIYKARTDVILDELGTFLPTSNSNVNFKIYVNQNGKKPTSGKLAYSKNFKSDYTGYKRFDMGKTVAIPKGTKFSIVVTTKTNDGKYYAPFELTDAEQPVLSPAAVRPGQTCLYKSGKWSSVNANTKFSSKYNGYTFKYKVFNALAKGFGDKGGSKSQTIKVKTSKKMKKGKKLNLKAKVKKGKGKLLYQVSNTKLATVSDKGVVKAKKKGTVKVTVYATPTNKYKSAKKVVKIKIK